MNKKIVAIMLKKNYRGLTPAGCVWHEPASSYFCHYYSSQNLQHINRH